MIPPMVWDGLTADLGVVRYGDMFFECLNASFDATFSGALIYIHVMIAVRLLERTLRPKTRTFHKVKWFICPGTLMTHF